MLSIAMTTDVKDRLPDNPLGIEYQRPQQKIVRLSKLQRLWREKPLFYGGLAALLLLSVTVAGMKVLGSWHYGHGHQARNAAD